MAKAVCLVMAHGKIAAALVEASKRIAGECEQLFVYGSENVGPKQLMEDIADFIKHNQSADGIFILVCIKGGSYWNTAIRAVRDYQNVKVLAGVNLPMILSYVTKRNNLSFDELANTMLEDAKRGIVVMDTSEV